MKTILSIRRITVTLAASAAAVGLLLIAAPLAGAGAVSHHASGGGHFEAKGGGGTSEFMFAFNARQHRNYTKGQLEFHNLTNGTALHMKIISFEFLDETTVGLIGEVTKSVRANAEIGDCRAIKVQDNGEGRNAPLDMTSKLSNKCSGNSLIGTTWDEIGLIPLVSGNIQVR